MVCVSCLCCVLVVVVTREETTKSLCTSVEAQICMCTSGTVAGVQGICWGVFCLLIEEREKLR